MTSFKNHLLIFLGTFFIILGIIGIFVPMMPSTIFLLLAASCYARGSQRFYSWLMNNRWLGSIIRDYREGRGILLRQKLLTMIILWLTIGSSGYFFIEKGWVKIMLILIATGVSLHLIHLRTRPVASIENKSSLLPVTTVATKDPD